MTEHEITAGAMRVNFAADGVEAILQNVSMIMSTPEFSCPLDRKFAWVPDIDSPLPIAKARTAARLTEAIHTNEPRAEVISIKFDENGLEGLLRPRVKVRIRNGTI